MYLYNNHPNRLLHRMSKYKGRQLVKELLLQKVNLYYLKEIIHLQDWETDFLLDQDFCLVVRVVDLLDLDYR
tara:strand:- start:44 stop:259 length:216 start_codon:yes stop_codon:yes gene_type:complete